MAWQTGGGDQLGDTGLVASAAVFVIVSEMIEK